MKPLIAAPSLVILAAAMGMGVFAASPPCSEAPANKYVSFCSIARNKPVPHDYNRYAKALDDLQVEVAKRMDTSSDDYHRFSEKIDEAKETGVDEDDDLLLEATDVIYTVTDWIGPFASSDPLEIATGSIHIAMGLLSFKDPVVGEVIRAVLSVGGAILSVFHKQDSDPDLEDIFHMLIDLALHDCEDDVIRVMAQGVQKVVTDCKALVDTALAEGHDLSSGELWHIYTICLPDSLPQFVLYMESKTYDYAKEASVLKDPGKPDEGYRQILIEQKCALTSLRIYSDIGSLREMVMMEMYVLFSDQGEDNLATYARAWMDYTLSTDKSFLKDVLTIPLVNYIGLAAYFQGMENPTVVEFLGSRGVEDSYDELRQDYPPSRYFKISSEANPGKFLFHPLLDDSVTPPREACDPRDEYTTPFEGSTLAASWMFVGSVWDRYYTVEPLIYYNDKENWNIPMRAPDETRASGGGMFRAYSGGPDYPVKMVWKIIRTSNGKTVFAGGELEYRCGYLCQENNSKLKTYMSIGRPFDDTCYWKPTHAATSSQTSDLHEAGVKKPSSLSHLHGYGRPKHSP